MGLSYRHLLGPAMAVLFAGCATGDRSLFPPRVGEEKHTVWVVNHSARHTGIALVREEIPKGVWPASDDYKGKKYLEVGWGDDDGYRKDLTSGIVAKALVHSTRTVLLFDGFDAPILENFKGPEYHIVRVDLSRRGFDRLCVFIGKTHALDAEGKPIRLGDDWYRARGTYCILNTCNTWVAKGLKEAGCPVQTAWCTLPGPLLRDARRIGVEVK